MKRFANVVFIPTLVLACLLTIPHTARAQGGTPALVLSPPVISLTGQLSSGQFAITASDNSSIAPTITVTDPGICTQTLAITSVPNQGQAIIVNLFVLPITRPYGSLVCHIEVADSHLGAAQLLVTLINGEATGPNGQFAVAQASLFFAPTNTAGNLTSQALCLWNSMAGTTVDYMAAATEKSGGDWLQITPTSGSVPNQQFDCSFINVQVTPGTLAPGVYHGAVTITPTNLGDAPPLVVPVSLTISGNIPLVVPNSNLPAGVPFYFVDFNYQLGKVLPPPQTLTLLSGDVQPIEFTAKLVQGSPWLTIDPDGGRLSTPNAITFRLTPIAATLPGGGYYATIRVHAPQATNADFVIAAQLFINGGPMVMPGTPLTAFNFQTGGPNPPSQTITVATSGDPATISVLLPPNAPWLSVTPTQSTASADSPQALTVSVNPAGLNPGTYSTGLTISQAQTGGSFNTPVPVTMNVSNSALLNAAPSAINFTFLAPQQTPRPQTINLTSTASALPFTVAVSQHCDAVEKGAGASQSFGRKRPWFSVSPNSGVTQGTTVVPISLSVDPAVTSAETCSGLITVTSAGAANTIQIPVTLAAITAQ